jgi:ELWxxDGT repeat protein
MLIALGQRPATAAVGDAVAPSLLKDINPGANSSDPAFFVQKGNELFFLTIGGGAATDGLWKTDGTAAGTQLVKAVNTGGFIGADDAPTPSAHLTLVGDTLFFAAGDKSTGVELWKSDGTEAGTGLVKDLNTGGNLSLPTSFRVLGSKLLFRTTYDSTNGSELWTSDGTDAGTVMVKDINPGSANASPSNVTVVGDTAYFGANDGAHGKELWRTDGTAAGTVMVKDIYPSLAGPFGNTIIGDSDPSNFTALGGSVYFSASDGSDAAAGRHGRELWNRGGHGNGERHRPGDLPGLLRPRCQQLFAVEPHAVRQQHPLSGQRRHHWTRAVEDRRHRCGHGAGQRHQHRCHRRQQSCPSVCGRGRGLLRGERRQQCERRSARL